MKKKRLLVPAALAVSACTPLDGVCRKDETQYLYCSPDGGYLCGQAACAVERLPDGGPRLLSDGSPACMC